MFLIERNLFGILVTKITSKRFLVKFDSFQRPLPTFSFVAVSPNCLFLSKFQVLLSVLAKFGENVFVRKKPVLLFGHENYFQAVFSVL